MGCEAPGGAVPADIMVPKHFLRIPMCAPLAGVRPRVRPKRFLPVKNALGSLYSSVVRLSCDPVSHWQASPPATKCRSRPRPHVADAPARSCQKMDQARLMRQWAKRARPLSFRLRTVQRAATWCGPHLLSRRNRQAALSDRSARCGCGRSASACMMTLV